MYNNILYNHSTIDNEYTNFTANIYNYLITIHYNIRISHIKFWTLVLITAISRQSRLTTEYIFHRTPVCNNCIQ
jgi:hypothetical protein